MKANPTHHDLTNLFSKTFWLYEIEQIDDENVFARLFLPNANIGDTVKMSHNLGKTKHGTSFFEITKMPVKRDHKGVFENAGTEKDAYIEINARQLSENEISAIIQAENE